ncbi:MAG: hypothetical protein ACYTE3_30085, partial [Planctomycetota bacterium]
AFSYSWHISFPLKILGSSCLLAAAEWVCTQAEKQAVSKFDCRGLLVERGPGRLGSGAVHHGRAADAPAPLGILAAHKMPGSGTAAFDLAGGGNLDSLLQPLVGLLLWHLLAFLNRIRKRGTLRYLPTEVNTVTADLAKKFRNTPLSGPGPAIGFVSLQPRRTRITLTSYSKGA